MNRVRIVNDGTETFEITLKYIFKSGNRTSETFKLRPGEEVCESLYDKKDIYLHTISGT